MAHTLVNTIDEAWEKREASSDPFRAHLGGSMIGKECERELVYSFRWAQRPTFKGRMLRLFDRGHKEEFRFVEFLRMIGIEVREYAQRLIYDHHFALGDGQPYSLQSWDEPVDAIGGWDDVTSDPVHIARAESRGVKLKQWRISDVMNHFGGSLDGEGVAAFDIPVDERITLDELANGNFPNARRIPAGEKFLLEFKTHNTKSFTKLVTDYVEKAKPVHYAQMQVYMHKRNLRFAVYVAVNKNDDDLYIEVVEYDPKVGPVLLERAQRVIAARALPGRKCRSPAQFEAKFCDFAQQCFGGKALEKNCRSCKFSKAIENGEWQCEKWNAVIPVDAILKGCDSHSQITD